MKRIFIYNLLFVLMITACDEREKITIGETTNPILSSNIENSDIVLTEETQDNIFDNFSWSAAEFGFQSATSEYTFQMDLAGNNFENAFNLQVSKDLDFELTNMLVNSKLIAAGVVAGEKVAVEFRVSGTIHEDLVAYSNIIKVDVTPFETLREYPKLYVTGDHNGWGFDDQSAIFSVPDNDVYEGYIYLTDGCTMKFSYDPNWDNADAIIGDPDASGTTGTLQIANWGGNNIASQDGAGVYKIVANLPALTYSLLKTEWAITGDYNGWATDSYMTYDNATETFSLTADFTAGQFKFIANGDWGIVLGDDELDGIIEKGNDGNNIQINEAGNYTVTLNLNDAIYTYTISKN